MHCFMMFGFVTVCSGFIPIVHRHVSKAWKLSLSFFLRAKREILLARHRKLQSAWWKDRAHTGTCPSQAAECLHRLANKAKAFATWLHSLFTWEHFRSFINRVKPLASSIIWPISDLSGSWFFKEDITRAESDSTRESPKSQSSKSKFQREASPACGYETRQAHIRSMVFPRP